MTNDNEKNGNGKKTKKQVAFDWAKVGALLAALLSSVYANTNSASTSSVNHVVAEVNDQLVPVLQAQLEQFRKDNNLQTERIVRLEVQVAYMERLLQSVERKLDRLSRHRRPGDRRPVVTRSTKPESPPLPAEPTLIEMLDAATKDMVVNQAQKPIALPKIKAKAE